MWLSSWSPSINAHNEEVRCTNNSHFRSPNTRIYFTSTNKHSTLLHSFHKLINQNIALWSTNIATTTNPTVHSEVHKRKALYLPNSDNSPPSTISYAVLSSNKLGLQLFSRKDPLVTHCTHVLGWTIRHLQILPIKDNNHTSPPQKSLTILTYMIYSYLKLPNFNQDHHVW